MAGLPLPRYLHALCGPLTSQFTPKFILFPCAHIHIGADFKAKLKENFDTVRECRLKATRKESAETFMYAEGYFAS